MQLSYETYCIVCPFELLSSFSGVVIFITYRPRYEVEQFDGLGDERVYYKFLPY